MGGPGAVADAVTAHHVEIHRPDGVITIVAPGASADRWQIEGAQLGDQPIGLGDRLRHEALLQGQPLTFEMAP